MFGCFFRLIRFSSYTQIVLLADKISQFVAFQILLRCLGKHFRPFQFIEISKSLLAFVH